MRYKAVSLAVAILLIATPTIAQEVVSILVETPRTVNPTTVMTGQSFTQTYIVRYLDLTDQDEEIEVQVEELRNLRLISNFEVLNLEIFRTTVQKEFLEHYIYLTFTLHIINDKKGPYTIDPITIPWTRKKIGQSLSDPSLVNRNLRTEEVPVNYVTTIEEEATYLDIRDKFDLGSSGGSSLRYKITSWVFATFAVSVVLFLTYSGIRSHKIKKNASELDLLPDSLEADDLGVSILVLVPKNKAVRNIRKALNEFYMLNPRLVGRDVLLRLEVRLSEYLNDYLRAELSLNIGATPADMAVHVEKKIKDGHYKRSLLSMIQTADFYYQDVQRGSCSSAEFIQHTTILRKTFKSMSWYRKIFRFIGGG